AAALAAAEKLAAGDEILAALAAVRGMRGRSVVYGEAAVAQAEIRIGDLAEVTATLRFPADWPDDVVLAMDRQPVWPEDGMIAGISLRSHRFEVSRPGYRPQALLRLQFGGKGPVDFPVIEWQMIGGKVVITSIPAGAAVWSGGKDTGKTTPCEFEQVEVGKVDYVLKLKDHVDVPLTGEVGNLETLELASSLAESPWLPEPGKVAGERREFNLTPDLRVAFRWCPAGAFVMGGAGPLAKKQEKPARQVELTVGYWLAETEFTQRQWEAVLGHDDLLRVLLTTGGGGVNTQLDHPMRLVSWDRICGNKERSGGLLGKINAFFTANQVAGWEVDLPTEAQWEYACRAGTRSLYGTEDQSAAGVDRIAWHRGNSGGHLQPVAQKDANPWGLRDMHGNIGEWCRDWFVETYDKQPTSDPAGPPSGWKKSLRGGSWLSSARSCGSPTRMEAYPSTAHPAIGFRLMLRSGKP
ncbi:MAG: SUMF1/EgtB/PvdO family nonheme iron enzyme, partial [Akkermansiaceae bacterium]|nr:SUMF1/EgtB/PvdO family nonheme iron enzyme [Akkermansiaceae bacterium]